MLKREVGLDAATAKGLQKDDLIVYCLAQFIVFGG